MDECSELAENMYTLGYRGESIYKARLIVEKQMPGESEIVIERTAYSLFHLTAIKSRITVPERQFGVL